MTEYQRRAARLELQRVAAQREAEQEQARLSLSRIVGSRTCLRCGVALKGARLKPEASGLCKGCEE